MKFRPLPSTEILKEYFDYNPLTGSFKWKKKAANNTIVGQEIQGRHSYGYAMVRFLGQSYLVHRLIYRMMTGVDPKDREIDHRNSNTEDNRWSNLRLAEHKHNARNQRLQKNNTSGVKGVSWHYQSKRWRACVAVGPRGSSKLITFGLFKTIPEAAEAVRKGREKLHAEFTNHGFDRTG